MYLCAHDEALALAVWRFEENTREEWRAHFEDLRQVARWRQRSERRVAAILFCSRVSMPTADIRSELTELTAAPGYDPFVAFVAPNETTRLVLKVFSWLQKSPRYETKYVTGADDGIAWLESKRGSPLPELRAMVERVMRQPERQPRG